MLSCCLSDDQGLWYSNVCSIANVDSMSPKIKAELDYGG